MPQEYPAVLYLEDLQIGQKIKSGTIKVTQAEIIAFAAKFDPQPFHLDPAAAQTSFFGGLVASGWHTASLTMRLLIESGMPMAGGIIGLNVAIKWVKPVRPDDLLMVESEIMAIEPFNNRADCGAVTVKSTTRNQDGADVQELTARLLAFRKIPVKS